MSTLSGVHCAASFSACTLARYVMAAVHPLILADVEGWVEEDVQEINHYLHSAVERRMKTTCTWASLYTDANRLLPIPARAKWSSESEGAQRPSPLAVLCDEFPELFSVSLLFVAVTWQCTC